MEKREVDPCVIDACRRGDRAAYRLLFDACKDGVYSTALAFFHGDAVTAEDVTQEVFLRVFTGIGQFHGRSGFRTWLYRIVLNSCIDERRRRRPTVALERAESHPGGEDPVECAARSELSQEVQAAVAALGAPLRAAVLLKYFGGLSYQEMAEALDCSTGTVASRLYRAHQALARRLAHLRQGADE